MTTLWVPVLRRSYQLSEAKRAERLFYTKLRLVRKYYPQLHELTYTEIIEQYDVEALYDNIGRDFYTRSLILREQYGLR
jgi:hypothetical protein